MKSTPRSAYSEGALWLMLSLALFAYALNVRFASPSVSWALSPSLFPLTVSIVLCVLSISLLRKAPIDRKEKRPPLRKKAWALTLGAAVGYGVFMPVLGFATSTAVFLFGMFFCLGERRPLILILVPIAFAAITYILFAKTLYVMLPFSSLDILRLGLDALMGG